ncbi:hypothetical protein [Vulcanisaeta sp. JCM 16161]|uniref:hypothetical protein n=1 Tax=Vulcanisaeta sp. JCM 16161 TaxID=1295372 RepID=UPI000A52FD6E|nr:hypothetical protein [Vulcanisaeta sp. JCM 16161]
MESFNVKWYYLEEGKSNAPLPTKGIAEGPLIGVLPALTRAVENAVGRRITRIPIDPSLLVK